MGVVCAIEVDRLVRETGTPILPQKPAVFQYMTSLGQCQPVFHPVPSGLGNDRNKTRYGVFIPDAMARELLAGERRRAGFAAHIFQMPQRFVHGQGVHFASIFQA